MCPNGVRRALSGSQRQPSSYAKTGRKPCDFRPVSAVPLALANRRLQPLGHLTADCKYTPRKHFARLHFSCVKATVFQTVALVKLGRKIGGFRYDTHERWAHSRSGTEHPGRTDSARCASLRFRRGNRAGIVGQPLLESCEGWRSHHVRRSHTEPGARCGVPYTRVVAVLRNRRSWNSSPSRNGSRPLIRPTSSDRSKENSTVGRPLRWPTQ